MKVKTAQLTQAHHEWGTAYIVKPEKPSVGRNIEVREVLRHMKQGDKVVFFWGSEQNVIVADGNVTLIGDIFLTAECLIDGDYFRYEDLSNSKERDRDYIISYVAEWGNEE